MNKAFHILYELCILGLQYVNDGSTVIWLLLMVPL